MNAPAPAVQVAGLSFHYPDGRAALAELSFRIEPGEQVGLLGPNGAGKTTLLLTLAGVLAPFAGDISLFGLNPGKAGDRRQLPTRLGLLFQDPDDQLFCPSVADELAFGPLNLGVAEPEVRERIGLALAAVGLPSFADRVPHQLSGGEKRRIALASILAMQPDLLLLDEPTAFLDPRGRREFLGLLRTLPQTKLIASHDLAFIQAACSRVLLLDGGRLLVDGPTDRVIADHGLLHEHGLED